MSSSPSDVYVRAVPKRVAITESYAYEQGRIRDDDLNLAKPPEAQVEVLVPYDGNRFVTEETIRDAHNQRSKYGDASPVQIGHLVFAGAERTDLRKRPDVSRHGSLSTSYSTPLHLPLDLTKEPSEILNTGTAAVAAFTYSPEPPQLVPIRVMLKADDDAAFSKDPSSETKLQFGSSLRLQFTIVLQVPIADGAYTNAKDFPSRIDVGVQWPTSTSLKSIAVSDRDLEADTEEKNTASEPKNLRYNPHSRQIEWTDTPDLEVKEEGGERIVHAQLTYFIDLLHPGELKNQRKLKGSVRVCMSDFLLSGLEVCVADGLGQFSESTSVKTETFLKTQFAFSLDDVFESRDLNPYYRVHFDGVIPNKNRIEDIKLAFENRGFKLTEERSSTKEKLLWLLKFTRKVGVDTMELTALVKGEEYRGEVQTETEGGETYRAEQRSGEMIVHLYGALPRNDQGLIREMNAVHQSLYDISSYVRARR